MKTISLILLLILFCSTVTSQQPPQTDSNTPLHRLKPNYPVPYGLIKAEEIAAVLNRVHAYLDQVTPVAFVNSKTNEVLTDLTKIDENTILKPGDFRIVSYEWGVTYAGMLLASQATGDPRFRDYTETRLQFIADAVPFFRRTTEANADWGTRLPLRNLLAPRALDDCGAMCAAMIKANRGGSKANLRPLIESHINYIMTREYRLQDGTLARNRPQPNTIWLDDLFMSVPAIAQMGKLTGETKYFDEASKQVLSYAKRMFNKEKGLFFHGWVEAMTEHPEFYWARANGWAFMTEVELLEVLPENHPSRPQLLQLLRAHAKGLASYQSGSCAFEDRLLDGGPLEALADRVLLADRVPEDLVDERHGEREQRHRDRHLEQREAPLALRSDTILRTREAEEPHRSSSSSGWSGTIERSEWTRSTWSSPKKTSIVTSQPCSPEPVSGPVPGVEPRAARRAGAGRPVGAALGLLEDRVVVPARVGADDHPAAALDDDAVVAPAVASDALEADVLAVEDVGGPLVAVGPEPVALVDHAAEDRVGHHRGVAVLERLLGLAHRRGVDLDQRAERDREDAEGEHHLEQREPALARAGAEPRRGGRAARVT